MRKEKVAVELRMEAKRAAAEQARGIAPCLSPVGSHSLPCLSPVG